MGGQAAAHLLGRQRADVQAKTVAVFLGGEAVRKNPGEILRSNAQAVVGDDDLDPSGAGWPDRDG